MAASCLSELSPALTGCASAVGCEAGRGGIMAASMAAASCHHALQVPAERANEYPHLSPAAYPEPPPLCIPAKELPFVRPRVHTMPHLG